MKGVVLAGGLGTRLYPLTHATNKHLLPVYNAPMIFYPIKTLVSAGISEILVVTSGPYAGHFIRVLKNGKQLGVTHLEYAFQEKPNGGIADALLLAQDFADEEPITVILGDNTTDADISTGVKSFSSGAVVYLKKFSDRLALSRFGVAQFGKDKKTIIRIDEKPQRPKSDFAVTGLYIYDKNVFNHIKRCQPSPRGEIEITDVNNRYIEKGQLTWIILSGFWSDAGTFETLYKANEYWSKKGGI